MHAPFRTVAQAIAEVCLLAGCPEAAEVAIRDGEIAVALAPGVADHAPLAARLVAAAEGD